MTATIILTSILSPIVVQVLKRERFTTQINALIAFGVVVVFYALGQFLDNSLSWPLAENFWIGLLAAFGGQQGVYNLVGPRVLAHRTTGPEEGHVAKVYETPDPAKTHAKEQ